MNLEALSNLASMQQPIHPPVLKRGSTGTEEIIRSSDISGSIDFEQKSPMTLLVAPPVASRQTSFGTK